MTERTTGDVSGPVLPGPGIGCMIGPLNVVRRTIVDTLYPPRCAGCARQGTWVCASCEAALPRFSPPWCERCGLPSDLRRCFCDNLPPELHIVRSAASFDGWLRQAIVSLKHREEWAREAHLGRLLADVLVDFGPVDALVPVPLHPSRLRQRGYNQSALLARRAGQVLGIPVLEALVRLRPTLQQIELGAAARRTNVAGAFAAIGDVGQKRLVVIDDVVTTGSTLGASATALTASGATEVLAATLAREL